MNDRHLNTTDDLKAFQLLSEVADEKPITQRELATRLGVALGLVNSYIKNFVAKGYLRIKNYPPNRYGYLLTPHGLAEKTRLAYQHAHYFTNLYTVTRQDYLALFKGLAERGITSVAFCGVDEVAEIAWLSLREAGLGLSEVMDDHNIGSDFMGYNVVSLNQGLLAGSPKIIITSMKRSDQLKASLLDLGVRDESIIGLGVVVAPNACSMY
ncbi:MAG TPA: winged helix-turn-helix transcriptional regulator [Desulfuromonadaceae bacterium]|jgi:DNA-binding MarR family transcriptional regulator